MQSPESCRRVSDSVDPIEREEQRELKTFRIQFKHLQAEGCPTLFTQEDVVILLGENWQVNFLVISWVCSVSFLCPGKWYSAF